MKRTSLYLMAMLYVAAGINHFWHPELYFRIMPPYLPAPKALNYVTGVAEIILGVLVCLPATRKLAAWLIVLMLVAFLTVHIYMLQQALNVKGYAISPAAAWLRLALQPLLIAWALWHRR